jgi:hypothetical protein
MSKLCIWFVAYNYSVYKGCFTVINVSVNRVSTILSLTHLANNGLHCHIRPKRMDNLAYLWKKQISCSLPHPKNERQWSINDFWHCVIKHPVGCAVTVCHNRTIGHLLIEQWWWQHVYYVLKMSVTRVSTTFGLSCWKMYGLCGDITP